MSCHLTDGQQESLVLQPEGEGGSLTSVSSKIWSFGCSLMLTVLQTDPGRLSPKSMFIVFYFRLVTVLDRDKAQIFSKDAGWGDQIRIDRKPLTC